MKCHLKNADCRFALSCVIFHYGDVTSHYPKVTSQWWVSKSVFLLTKTLDNVIRHSTMRSDIIKMSRFFIITFFLHRLSQQTMHILSFRIAKRSKLAFSVLIIYIWRVLNYTGTISPYSSLRLSRFNYQIILCNVLILYKSRFERIQ
jgi:hypothetical protein